MKYLIIFWKKAFTFEGRCSRSTFWYTILYNVSIEIGATGLGFLIYLLGNSYDFNAIAYFGMALFFAGIAYDAASIAAYISICVRRLHDRNMSGAFLLLIMFPAVQFFVLAMFLSGSKNAGNRWGLETD